MKIPFYLLIITALFTGNTVKAQAEQVNSAVPEALRGNWAAADCRYYDETIVFTQYFKLQATETDIELWPALLVETKENYSVIEAAGITAPMARDADGILKIANMPRNPETWPDTWGELENDGRYEFANCFEMPTLVPVPVAEALTHLDNIHAACHAEITNECGDLLFSIADRNNDKRISPFEFKETGALLFTLAPLMGQHAISTEKTQAAYKNGRALGEAIGERLIALKDKDKSGDLDKDELNNALSILYAPALKTALEQVSNIFPPFRAIALKLEN